MIQSVIHHPALRGCLRLISKRSLSFAVESTNHNFIDGNKIKGSSEIKFQNKNPGNGLDIGEICATSKEEVELSVATATIAFSDWSNRSAAERSAVFRKAGELLSDNVSDIARIESIDTGKTITEATCDVESVVDCINFYAAQCFQLNGQHIPLSGGNYAYTIREPFGVCAGIGAWNFPIANIAWKALPALAAGNSLVYKPSPLTPLTSVIFAEIMSEAGLPAGSLNIVQGGAEVGEILCQHPQVMKMSFTGSGGTGAKVMSLCAAGIKNVTLELGGKSPMVVFEDADMKNAVQGALMANYVTQGEVCSNGCRIYVHDSIYEDFVCQVLNAVKSLRLGDPACPTTQFGALISEDHLNKVEGFIERAKAEGAHILYGGDRPEHLDASISGGYYIRPCVMTGCTDDMEIIREEHFGPIMCILPFSSESEVLRRANDSRFGLAGGVFTRDISRAHRFISKLQAGSCCINTYNMYPVEIPWGGNKMSGIGRENGNSGLDAYTQLKSVYVECGDVQSMFL